MKQVNVFNSVAQNIDSFTSLLEKDFTDTKRLHKAIKILKRHQNVFKKKIMLKLTNGKKGAFDTVRIQHSDAKGPFRGGINIGANLSEAEIKAQAFKNTLQSALLDIPFGGSFSGIFVDLKKLSKSDIQRLLKQYSHFLAPKMGALRDILEGGRLLNIEYVSWMLEAFERRKKHHSPASFSGKPGEIGGLIEPNNLTSKGALYLLQTYLKKVYPLQIKNFKVAVLGFGEVGMQFSQLSEREGFKILAVSDSSGGIYDPFGLKTENITSLKEKFGSLKEASKMTKIKYIENSEILKLNVDILVVAANKSSLIDANNIQNIKAKIIVEIGDGNISFETEKNLRENKIELIPSILSNSGNALRTYFEWSQNFQGMKWSREKINQELKATLRQTLDEVISVSREKNISFSQACNFLAVRRVISAILIRGRV